MKTILPAASTYLKGNTKFRTAALVLIELPGSGQSAATYAYYTDYFRDVNYNGQIFRAGKLKYVGNNKQDRTLTIGSLTFSLSGADSEEVIKLVQNGVSFLDRQIRIWSAVIDNDGNVLPVDPDTNGPLIFFQGKLSAGSIKDTIATDSEGSSTVTWQCSNIFYDFDKVNGRMTDDASHRGLEVIDGVLTPTNGAKRDEYQEDYGFFHSNQSIDILAKYQVQEKKYKLQAKKKLFGLSKSYSMKEYYETVTKEVDIDFNLTAKFIPTVYGTQKIPGIPVFADTALHNPNEVYIVYAFCEGEIEGFLDFYLGDAPMICLDDTDSAGRTCFGRKKGTGDTIQRIASGIANSSPSVHGQEYKYDDGNGKISVWTFHGTKSQTVAPVLRDLAKSGGFYFQDLNKSGPEYWDDRFKLLDTAYAIFKFEIGTNRTDIPEISAEVVGKRVRVYNQDGTYDSTKTSMNPVWQMLDYLTSTTYGASVSVADVPSAQLITEASILDQVDTSYQQSWQPYWRYVGWRSISAENRQMIQLNTIIDTSQSVFKNCKSMLESFNGALNNINGKYRLTVEKLVSNPIKISSAEVIGDIQLDDTTGRQKYNSVQASITDPAKLWKSTTVTFFNSKFKAQDNNISKNMQLSFDSITNYYTARGFAERELKKSRYSRQVQITVPLYFTGIECNDAVAFTHERYGWTDKYFLVDSVENTRDGKINLVLQEYGEDVFINSPMVEQNDTVVPNITNAILPPRDFQYIPYHNDASNLDLIGRNGILSWLPSLTPNISYYTIAMSGKLDPYVVDALGSTDLNSALTLELEGLEEGLRTFEIRAVDILGRRSAPVVLSVNINSSMNLSVVPNFRLLNIVSPNSSEFYGPDMNFAWDNIPEAKLVKGIYYELEIRTDKDATIRSVQISNGNLYSYLLTFNKADFNARNGRLGIYRNVVARIRAKGPKGEQSIDWVTL